MLWYYALSWLSMNYETININQLITSYYNFLLRTMTKMFLLFCISGQCHSVTAPVLFHNQFNYNTNTLLIKCQIVYQLNQSTLDILSVSLPNNLLRLTTLYVLVLGKPTSQLCKLWHFWTVYFLQLLNNLWVVRSHTS